MLIKQIMMGIIGISSGLFVAVGFIAFITLIGIFPRLQGQTRTAKYAVVYENFMVLGVLFGNIMSMYKVGFLLGPAGTLIYGFFSGIFVGCLAGALSEVLNVIPVFSRRAKMRTGLAYIVIFIAIGKGLGSVMQFFVLK